VVLREARDGGELAECEWVGVRAVRVVASSAQMREDLARCPQLGRSHGLIFASHRAPRAVNAPGRDWVGSMNGCAAGPRVQCRAAGAHSWPRQHGGRRERSGRRRCRDARALHRRTARAARGHQTCRGLPGRRRPRHRPRRRPTRPRRSAPRIQPCANSSPKTTTSPCSSTQRSTASKTQTSAVAPASTRETGSSPSRGSDKAAVRRAAARTQVPRTRADVDEPKSGENCMHLDIETPTVDAGVARLEELGCAPARGRRHRGTRQPLGRDGRHRGQRVLRLERGPERVNARVHPPHGRDGRLVNVICVAWPSLTRRGA
jgi:hypothetical protein